MNNSAYFLSKAAQCRRLAKNIISRDDPAVKNLLALAVEFEEKARMADRQNNAFHHNGESAPFPPLSEWRQNTNDESGAE
jgi:hypothetical protein